MELYLHCVQSLNRREEALLKPINNANASQPAEIFSLLATDLILLYLSSASENGESFILSGSRSSEKGKEQAKRLSGPK